MTVKNIRKIIITCVFQIGVDTVGFPKFHNHYGIEKQRAWSHIKLSKHHT